MRVRAKTCPSRNTPRALRDDDDVSRVVPRIPLANVVVGLRIRIERRAAILDALIVDRADRIEICGDREADGYWPAIMRANAGSGSIVSPQCGHSRRRISHAERTSGPAIAAPMKKTTSADQTDMANPPEARSFRIYGEPASLFRLAREAARLSLRSSLRCGRVRGARRLGTGGRRGSPARSCSRGRASARPATASRRLRRSRRRRTTVRA